jgi:hypothetical protein
MKICYELQPALPMLGWCARIDMGCDAMTVIHGSGVETFPEAFVEGAWDGEFAERAFHRATIFSGTAGAAGEDGVRFYAGTDKLSPLFSVGNDECVYVSNSPFFVMTQAGIEPDDHYPFYAYDLVELWRRGVCYHKGSLRMRLGRKLGVHFCGIHVDQKGNIALNGLPVSPPPVDYSSYKQLLQEGIQRVLDNAADKGRRRTYTPIVSMSKGYDSTAVAALAKSAGCRDILTYIDSHEADPSVDSGKSNAAILGMNCKEGDRRAYLGMGGRVEPEFAFIPLSCMVPLAVFENQLAGRILMGGNFGDTAWDPKEIIVCRDMAYSWSSMTSGLGQLEFRLRVGFLMFAVVYIGGRDGAAIARIIKSKEMSAWAVEGRYNRAVPRRIAEEAGIQNSAFCKQKKAMSSVNLLSPDVFSKEGLEDYLRFVEAGDARLSWLELFLWRASIAGRHAMWSLFGSRDCRFVLPTVCQRWFPFILNRQPLQIHRPFCYTFQWSFERLRGRYNIDDARRTGVVGDHGGQAFRR